MSALAELLDAVRERSGLPSDMALATKLGIQRQTLHQARKGVAGLSDERIAQLCELGKLDGAVWMAKIHAERATSPVERKVWRSVLDRLSAAAAVLMLVVVAAPGAARAKAIDSQGFSSGGQPHSVYYVTTRPGRTSPLTTIHFSCVSPLVECSELGAAYAATWCNRRADSPQSLRPALAQSMLILSLVCAASMFAVNPSTTGLLATNAATAAISSILLWRIAVLCSS